MDFVSLHPHFSPNLLPGKPRRHAVPPPLASSQRHSSGPDAPRRSGAVRRPAAPAAPAPLPLQTAANPLRNLPISEQLSTSSKVGVSSSSRGGGGRNPLSNKLWLSSRLAPPPPPPPPPPPRPSEETPEGDAEVEESIGPDDPPPPAPEFRQKGKIFVGNLPLWIKKNEVAEYFRQFGPVKSVILIKGHDDPEKNMGYCFVLYGGPTAADSAAKAVEFDGVEFHGRVLTVRLDDGRRLQARAEERARWLAGSDEREYRSKWHEERDGACRRFRRVLETEPENWQAVVLAFERIKKPSRREFGLMVNYYGRRGDKHHARSTFESMRARGIEPNSYVYTNLVHAYAVARDMRGALSCIQEMKEEGIELTLVTYSILIGGFANIGDSKGDVWEAADLMQQMKSEGVLPDIHTYTSFINACCKAGDMLKAMKTVEEMLSAGVKPNVKTYTTLIRGWARASLPEKALACFEEMKSAGMKPDKAAYHCLMTSLLSRATVAEEYICSGILNICREMIELNITVDMGTAIHWSKSLRKIERTGGELTEALQKTFPPAWNSQEITETDYDKVDEDEESLVRFGGESHISQSTVESDDNGNGDEDYKSCWFATVERATSVGR
ncbi:hypothetical protein Taro_040961 [Colocasia esculenta]|uniref:RRM domain-containing protein n=1 Tax=Colocasia esculenta TaxID=4460 RepID=A0A843WZH4_COLES|nr:hypothetical protein [Colocasia esculenta]